MTKYSKVCNNIVCIITAITSLCHLSDKGLLYKMAAIGEFKKQKFVLGKSLYGHVQ